MHACINDIESQYTIEINNTDKNYKKIYKIFEEEMQKQYPNRVTDITNGIPGVNILVPYWAWQNKSNEIYKILSEDVGNIDISMKLPLFRDYLHLCNCVVSCDKIEISPKSVNINEIEGFKKAQRRIYMSATIVEIDSLISKCGITNYPQNVIKPQYADDMGERFILFPQIINKEIRDEDIKNRLKEYSKQYNVVVLVPSDIRKQYWEDVADLSIDKYNLETEIERLRKEHIGLIVMSNKYEGIDLPNKACEILVIDGIPNSKRKYDEVEQQMIGNSEKILNKKIQLIEQGMGRGVRSSGDYCAIILMGQGLISTLYADGYIDKMSSITKEQIKLSNEIAKQLSGKQIDEIFESLNYCLKRDQNWIETSKSILSQIKYIEEAQKSDVENILSECFELAKSGEYDKCIEKLQNIINKQNDNDLKGYLKMQMAEYYNFIDKTKSQKILKSAHSLNNKLIKPMEGITYRKDITKINKQSKNIADFLEKNNYDFNKMIIKLSAVLEDLIFSDNTHKSFEKAVKEIAEFIGIESERPENDTGKGPDNLYWIENKYAMIIECKNEAQRKNNISKSDCNQLNGSNEWYKNNYGKSGIQGIPVLIHPSNIYNKDCSPNENTRIMTETQLDELKKKIHIFIMELSQQSDYKDIKTIEMLLKNNKLFEKQLIDNYRIKYIMEK